MQKVWPSDITGIHTHLQHWIAKECMVEPDNQITLKSHPWKGLRRLQSQPATPLSGANFGRLKRLITTWGLPIKENPL
jgi:hypothetical protein